MKLAFATAILFAAMLTTSSQAQVEACPDRVRLANHSGKAIYLAKDTLFFRTSAIELDIDGSPNAYGVHDQGTENICNGLGPLLPPSCRGKIRGACYTACQAAFRAWDGNPSTLKNHMCSIGLGGGSCGTPNVRLQSAPRADWFVSETSYHPKPDPGVSVGTWLTMQEGQLDSTRISYFVIPGGFRGLPWDSSPGDAGVVLGPDGRAAFFVIGDSGGALNEGSAALLARLRNLEELPTTGKRNAFGVEVRRLAGAVEGDYRVAIFRHTNERLAGFPQVLAISSADLPDWIERVGQQKLREIGGIETVRSCS